MAFDLEGKYIEESEIFEQAQTEPMPCLLLNPNLTPNQISLMEHTHIVVEVMHEGKPYKATLLGYYRNDPNNNPNRKKSKIDNWNK